jgi:hypothetical protein
MDPSCLTLRIRPNYVRNNCYYALESMQAEWQDRPHLLHMGMPRLMLTSNQSNLKPPPNKQTKKKKKKKKQKDKKRALRKLSALQDQKHSDKAAAGRQLDLHVTTRYRTRRTK